MPHIPVCRSILTGELETEMITLSCVLAVVLVLGGIVLEVL
jgi:hypothetical protein